MSKLYSLTRPTLIVTVVTSMLVMPFIVDAKPGGKKGGKPRAEAQFERLDANLDGLLTLDELTAPASERAEKMLERKDADESGALSFEEATGGRETNDFSDIADDIVQCVTDLQAESGDDSIVVPDASRFTTSAQDRFDAKDTSGDGVLDIDELQADAIAKATEKFAAMDADDGETVTEEEFTAAQESAKATRQAIKSCIDELTSDDI